MELVHSEPVHKTNGICMHTCSIQRNLSQLVGEASCPVDTDKVVSAFLGIN